jgi:hypothetical protein
VAFSVCYCVFGVLEDKRIPIFSLLRQVVPVLSWMTAVVSTRTGKIYHVIPNSSSVLLVLVLEILLIFLFFYFFASSFNLSNLDCQLTVLKLGKVLTSIITNCNKWKALYLKLFILKAIKVKG